MRLVNLKGSFFRGFGNTPTASFDAPLVIIFGPNGSGKTSIAESLEWLFFGTTRRRIRAEVDEVEYRGHFQNVTCPDGCDPFVELEVHLDNGRICRLRRVLHIDGVAERTTAYLDDVEVHDFSAIGLENSEHFYPIVVQHNLQELILSTGAKRRQFISRLLGLGPLLAYDRALDSAIDRFENSLPKDIYDKFSEFKKLRNTLGQKLALQDIVTRWNSDDVRYPSDWNQVLQYVQTKLDMPTAPIEMIKAQASKHVEDAKKAVFDINPFGPRKDLPDHSKRFDSEIIGFRTSFNHLKQATSNYASVRATIYGQLKFSLDSRKLEIWKIGLELIDIESIPDSQPVQCPFCEEFTITKEKAKTFKGRLEATDQYSQTREHLEETIESCRVYMANIETACKPFLMKKPDEESRSSLLKLLPTKDKEIQEFGESISELYRHHDLLKTRLQEIRSGLDQLLRMIDDPSKVTEVENFLQNTEKDLVTPIDLYKDAVKTHHQNYEAIWGWLQPVLVSNEIVQERQFIETLSNAQAWIMVSLQILSTLKDLRGARQAVRDYLRKEDIARIKDRGEDIRKWFDLLYGCSEQGVTFDSVDPSGTVMRILASIFGEKRHASTHMSQSQLNCLGLSMHIVGTTWQDSPFKFILFDDPIQSFDDDHIESFKSPVITKLIDEYQRQVIVMTHIEKQVADSIRNQHRYRNPIYYHLNAYGQDGLTLRERIPIRDELKVLQGQASAASDQIRMDCRRGVRVPCEKIVKELHRHEVGTEIPREYQGSDVTWNQLKRLCLQIPSMTTQEITSLDDTCSFCDPEHHDDACSQAPSQAQLTPHIDRLFTFTKKKGLLS